MKKITALTLACLLVTANNSLHSQTLLKTYGVQINVLNLKKALLFYSDVLGFEPGQTFSGKTIALKPKTGNDIIILNEVSYLLPIQDNETRASLTLQVTDLDSSITRLKSHGVDFNNYHKRKEGVGYAIYFDDPFGTRLSMMQETVAGKSWFAEPRIYNYGFYVPDMDTAIQFFSSKLGFPIRSKNYLPLDLPLNNTDQSFGFMLHTRNGVQAIYYNSPDNEHIVILFQTPDMNETMKALKKNNVQIIQGKTSNIISFYNPFGYISSIIEIK